MGTRIQLEAADGHRFSVYQAEPSGTPRAGLVVLQEIFGITDHIERVTDGFASEGYLAMAPAMFDRIAPGINLDYSDIQGGVANMQKLDIEQSLLDIQATIKALRVAGKVGAVGYCWGGSMADLASCRLDLGAAAAYYGARTVNWLDEKPNCPVIYHFGDQDASIPPEAVEKIRQGRPNGIVHVYAGAGHGFNCDDRADFSAASAALALERSLEFFARILD